MASAPALTAFGVAAVSTMLLCYWLEERWVVASLAFGFACMASSAYGWLAGAWPFGVVEIVWAMVAFARWRRRASMRT